MIPGNRFEKNIPARISKERNNNSTQIFTFTNENVLESCSTRSFLFNRVSKTASICVAIWRPARRYTYVRKPYRDKRREKLSRVYKRRFKRTNEPAPSSIKPTFSSRVSAVFLPGIMRGNMGIPYGHRWAEPFPFFRPVSIFNGVENRDVFHRFKPRAFHPLFSCGERLVLVVSGRDDCSRRGRDETRNLYTPTYLFTIIGNFSK